MGGSSKISYIIVGITLFILGLLAGRITVNEDENENVQPTKVYSNSTVKNNSQIITSVDSPKPYPTPTSFFQINGSKEEYKKMFLENDGLNQDLNKSVLHALISQWAEEAPLEAMEYAQTLNRVDLMHECLCKMAEQDADGALAWVNGNSLKGSDKNYLLTAVYQEIAKKDPEGTVALIEGMPKSIQREQLLEVVVSEWAKKDVQATFDWLETAELGSQLANIYENVIDHYIEESPTKAAELITEMYPSDIRTNFASHVAYKLAQQDVANALSWADGLDNKSKTEALLSIVDSWSEGENAQDALNYVMQGEEDVNRVKLFSVVTKKLAENNPEYLESALVQMSNPDQVVAARELAAAYSVNDPQKGLKWIDSLEAGTIRDTAVSNTIPSYVNNDISKAFELSETLSNDSLRIDQMREVVSTWFSLDPTAAERALNSSSALSNIEKQNLLDRIKRRVVPSDYILPITE